MATRSKWGRGGIAWLTLIFLPPVLVLAGLAAMFIWQGSKDGITPKWRKPPTAVTNPAAPSLFLTNRNP